MYIDPVLFYLSSYYGFILFVAERTLTGRQSTPSFARVTFRAVVFVITFKINPHEVSLRVRARVKADRARALVRATVFQ